MKIVKSEKVYLSEEEDNAWILMEELCWELAREARCPEIIKQAMIITEAMSKLFEYVEEE